MDQSASITAETMRAQKSAVKRIALGDVSSSSHVSVFGFAAAESAEQRAVDPVCPRTPMDAAGREAVGSCVDELRARKQGEGAGTDLASAIRHGVNDLSFATDDSQPRVLFLLTDGRMDVADSPQYGDPAHRQAEGERRLKLALKDAAAKQVQIWPLGFGPALDRGQLDRIAAGGYQKGCGELPSATPKAHTVSGAQDVGPALEKVFASALCLRHEEGTSGRPPAGLEVGISPLATVGSIVVDKGDAEVKITYIDPSGHKVPTTGAYKSSQFERAGADGTVEALKIFNPLPGTWKVRAEAPEGHRSLPVAVSVLWQGELRGAVTMDPPSPQAGEKVTVTMRLQTREGYEISDPDDYQGLRVRAELTGDGFAPRAFDLSDDGKGPDTEAGDGSLTGAVTIPREADGAFKVKTTLTAPGLRTATRSEVSTVASSERPVTAALLELPRGERHPGDKIAADLAVRNTTDTPHTLRLSITDVSPGLLSVTPDEIEIRPGEQATRRVTIQVAPAGAFGDRLTDGLRLVGTFSVVDVTDYGRVLAQSLLSVPITPEPAYWEKFEPVFFPTTLLAALCAAGVLALVLQRQGLKSPSGLVLPAPREAGAVLSARTARHGGDEQRSAWSWADEPRTSADDEPPVPTPRQEARPPTQAVPRTAGHDSDDGSVEPRWLVAELAEQTPPGREVPLQVQIVRDGPRGTGVQLRPFHLPREGARVRVTVHATGLVVLDELVQELHVLPGRDSDVLLFRLKAPMPGLHRVTVRAYRNGTFLGEVTCQISVGHGSVTRDGPPRHAPLPSMAFDPGEVTLQVLKGSTAGTFSFQLISETFYPPEIIHFVGDSRTATEQIYAELKRAAKAAAANGGEKDAQRLRARLRSHGVQLWNSAVPQAVQRQFWDQAERVSAFTVLGEHDAVPWELLYPLNVGHDDRGFLAEWLPVVRRVFNQDRVRSLSLPGAAFVVPPGSPVDASLEVASLRVRLGTEVADGGVLTERAALTALIEDGHAGLLHFACHNAFTGSGSCVTMADGPFDPIDLASAAQLHTLRPHRPLVFFNACRSAGEINWFGESLGWAPQFLTAGAGAFVGTLWPVRSQSALQFAEAFYDELIANGQPLGHASLAARQTIRDVHGGDPTWLAYAVYGSPAATAHTTE
ncbi:CHAT domain-containing protein [Streptomyces caeruleatus]|uniref:CHAT domain-containing protein n=1 Tax=Streptomyces caeruleatus TaxID=661399 RepID=UPI001FC953BF|nr:CHAT domain-containing protein [Streptomyces caeruleatus]